MRSWSCLVSRGKLSEPRGDGSLSPMAWSYGCRRRQKAKEAERSNESNVRNELNLWCLGKGRLRGNVVTG